MIRTFFNISIFVFACFLLESILAQVFVGWVRPNLLIILIVFFNLFRGIRYSLLTALVAGLLKDCYHPTAFGINTFSFICCAYVASFVKLYIYEVGSVISRVLMVFLISLFNVVIHYILNIMMGPVLFSEMFIHVLVPEVLITTFISSFMIERLKRCALRLFA